jgi:hypothetical protein
MLTAPKPNTSRHIKELQKIREHNPTATATADQTGRGAAPIARSGRQMTILVADTLPGNLTPRTAPAPTITT